MDENETRKKPIANKPKPYDDREYRASLHHLNIRKTQRERLGRIAEAWGMSMMSALDRMLSAVEKAMAKNRERGEERGDE